jgi:hypothetical protein
MNPVTILLLLHAMQSEAGRQAEQRIKQAQYCAAVEARAQHREIERAQPASHLAPAEEAGNRKAAADRLIGAGVDRETIATQAPSRIAENG